MFPSAQSEARLHNEETQHESVVETVPDLQFLRRAIDQAESNALRVALYQATGDRELLEYRLVSEVLEKGHLTRRTKLAIAEEDRPALEEKAVRFLSEHAGTYRETVPSDAEVRSLIELALGRKIAEESFPELKAAASFDAFPLFHATWKNGTKPEIPEDFSVAIIGSGHSGIAMGVQLSLLQIPYVIYERRPDLGGVWSVNRYPDIRVDTMSSMYQLGFVKRYPWSEYFARGPEVSRYMTHTARHFAVYEQICFEHEVRAVRFDPETSRWELEIAHGGEVIQTSASIVVSATGLFLTPKKLDIDGIDDFQGDLVHTTRWPEDYSVTGKTVAVIGNGSTGVQLLSPVAAAAKEVYVFVRTPQWVTPQVYYGEPILPELQWLLKNMPYYWNWDRFVWTAPSDNAIAAWFVPDPEWKAKGGHFSEGNDELRARLTQYIKEQTGFREELYERLIPHYPPWARRMIVDNNWYKTLTKDHIELVTDPIDHIDANAIVTADGQRREVDVIITASGFDVTKHLYPIKVEGGQELTLEQKWENDECGPRAFWSITVPGFPNLFIMYGPNSQGGAGGSISGMLQLWATYIAGLCVQLVENGSKQLEVREDVFAEHNRILDERTSQMIWMDPDSKDRNYYVSRGRVHAMNAWAPAEHWEAMTNPNLLRDYHVK
jgi:4-hydroxyacetophenone monooxygenase